MKFGRSLAALAAVAAGGAAGGLLRVLTLAAWPASEGRLPLALLTINAGGSALIGLVLAFSEPGGRRRMPPALALGLMAGFCGALTTFSTFAVDVLLLAPVKAVGYLFASLVCWLVSVALGLALGRRLNRPLEIGQCGH